MHKENSVKKIVFLVYLVLSFHVHSDDELGYVGKSGKVFGFDSVAEALKTLKSKSNSKVSNYEGWIIVNDTDEKAVWSFAPEEHDAFPSVVKREVAERDGSIFISTQVRCGAKKSDCDKLVQDFIALNERIKESVIE